MSHRLMAILEFDAGRLRELLQLSEAAEIVGARMDFETRGRIQLKVEGVGYPVAEGNPIPSATCIVESRRDEDGSIPLNPTLNWPFDSSVQEA